MPDDIFAAVAKGLGAMEEEASHLHRTAAAVADGIKQLRSKLYKEERTKELLDRIEQYRRGLGEIHQTLATFLKNV